MSLNRDFYLRSDTLQISRELLGKTFITHIDGQLTSGIIVETEAYCGAVDAACHAYPNKITKRTRQMYEQGGCAYVYICYGIHTLFNIVTNQAGIADAVLIRAIEPISGIDIMLKRRQLAQESTKMTAGPGCLTQALGIDKTHNGISLLETPAHKINQNLPSVWIEDQQTINPNDILSSTRIGVAGSGAIAAALPWRFYLKNNKWVSKG